MKTYNVTIPIAGHAVVQVEANSEEEAIQLAMESDQLALKSIEYWEPLERFNEGNVCYCPQPWEAEAVLAFGEEEEEEEAAS